MQPLLLLVTTWYDLCCFVLVSVNAEKWWAPLLLLVFKAFKNKKKEEISLSEEIFYHWDFLHRKSILNSAFW